MENIIRVKCGGSIKDAQYKARKLKNATVIVEKGVYRESLEFDERDSGTTYIGEDAVLTGGLEVQYSETKEIPEEIKARLSPEAAEKVRCIDLTAYGYTKDDWGEVYPIGSYNTARHYPNAKLGVNIEVFSGGKRMNLARYPDSGYTKLSGVLDQGEPTGYYCKEVKERFGGIYKISEEVNERAKKWRTPETAWMFGYFSNDWSDASTPIKVDTEKGIAYPRYVAVSQKGCKDDADVYYYNVLEELDCPGEYFLDRDTGMLFVYPFAEGDIIEVSLSEKPVISVNHAENITVKGFTVKCTRADGVRIKGNGCFLDSLTVLNVTENGIVVDGYRNTVNDCDISRTGRGGIILNGGDRITLTHAENNAVNNYIHHFSEVYQTYQAGVALYGVGNTCAHNEISFTPHLAILYSGNDHLIEYNNIHDAVLYSSDAGAIYAGKDWAGYGTVIRYNILRNIGKDDLRPDGIYWDDALCGQTAYGNILINVLKHSFLIGGGRDNTVKNNLIISDGETSISYDQRAYDGFFCDGWYNHVRSKDDPDNNQMWRSLAVVPYTSKIWTEKYPNLADFETDFNNAHDPRFPVYPVGAVVENNIIVRSLNDGMAISEQVRKYGNIGNNPWFKTVEEANFDLETLKFKVQPEGFPEIPVDKIGRNK